MNRFDQLLNILYEDITTDFNQKFCYIIGKDKLKQPNNQKLQCIYIDKHLPKQVLTRTFDGDIEFSVNKLEEKINKFICETINDSDQCVYIKENSNDSKLIQANFGIPYICECEKSKLKIKIFIRFDNKFNRFYGFAKTCWYSPSKHIPSKFHKNEKVRVLLNEFKVK